MNILLAITGSVAASLDDKIYDELSKYGEVRIIVTKSSTQFMSGTWMYKNSYTDGTEEMKWKFDKVVLHIELCKWADILVVAPLSANTLAKFSNGICDNLVTCVFRAWNSYKPVIFAPAMNTDMWNDPITKEQLILCQRKNVEIIQPQKKLLACKDFGIGAMADISELNLSKYLWGKPIYDGCSISKEDFTDISVPIGNHPGAFGAKRKHDVHAGVDLYTKEHAIVRAVEDGKFIGTYAFTGASVGSPWWNETKAMVVKGNSGYIIYGEVQELFKGSLGYGDQIKKGQMIGKVIPVLPEYKKRDDIPCHSNYMLHLEVMSEFDKHGQEPFSYWELDKEKPNTTIDPTRRLIEAYKKTITME